MATPPGDPVRRRTIIPPSQDPLTSSFFSEPSDADWFWEQYRRIEEDTNRRLKERLLDNYIHDPFRIRISSLGSEARTELTEQMDQLIGLGDLTAQGYGPSMFRDYTDSSGRANRSPAGRMVFDPREFMGEHIDPRALALSQTTVRYDNARSSLGSEKYFSAGSPYRADVLQHMEKVMNGGIDTSGPGMVFDVETPGLNPEEGIWQLSARHIKDGEVTDKTWHFANPKMKFGVVNNVTTGETQRLDQFLTPQEEEASTDFLGNMKEFLQMSKDSEWVAGHNVFFDYGMLARTLTRHNSYHDSSIHKNQEAFDEYRQQVDAFLGKFHNEGKIGNVIDTNVLARMVLPQMSLARELKDSETPYQFSLQNILLQTNLLSQLQAGGLDVNSMLEKGLHYADVDVPFESHLLTALGEHQKWLKGEGGTELKIGDDFLTSRQRRKIVTSAAITPNTRITDPDMILPEIRAKYGDVNITPMEQMVVAGRRLDLVPKKYDVKNDLDLATRINTWDRISMVGADKGWVTQGGKLAAEGKIPTPQEWVRIQQELADKGIPLPGISWMERHVTSALGQTISPNMPEKEQQIRRIFGSDIAPLGHFTQRAGVNIIGSSKLVQMPYSYIKDWRASQGDAETAQKQMAYLSPFRVTTESARGTVDYKDDVGLMVPLESEEKDSFLEYLRGREDIDSDLAKSIEDSFKNNTGTYGIQIATLGDLKGGQSAKDVHDLLASISGRTVDASDQTPQFWTHIAPGMGSEGAGPIYSFGAFMRPDLMNEDERKTLSSQAVDMVKHYNDTMERVDTPQSMNMFSGLRKVRGDEKQSQKLYRSLKLQKTLTDKAPLIAGVAAAFGVGYYAMSRHYKNKDLDQSYALMPYENSDWYAKNQQDMIPQNPSTAPNYLATANVVSQLDASKIGHTQMGNDRYSALYSGTLGQKS